MLITLTRYGGFTGIPFKKTVDTSALMPDKRKEIEELITQHKQVASQQSSPDRFTYTISVQDGATSQSIQLHEQSLSPEMKSLIQILENS